MNEPELRFKADDGSRYPDWEKMQFGEIVKEYHQKTKTENEDVLLSCAIDGIWLNSELFDHQRGRSNKGYLKIKKGDLILSAQNLHLGNANVNLKFESGIISPAYKVYDIIGCDPEFMEVWVKREETKRFFYNATTTGASQCRRNIEWDTLYNQVINLPCAEEQQKIANLFSTLDNVISSVQKEVDSWEQMKRGVMQKLFSQEVRFKADDGTEYPEWGEDEIGSFLRIRDVKQVPTKEAPLMAFIANVGVADKGERYDRSFLVKDSNKKYKRTELNDFIYSSNNLDVGSIGLNTYGTAVISVVYEIFKPKDNVIPIVLSHIIQQPRIMNEILKYRQGCLYGQYKIYPEDFLSVKIKMPCFEEQQKIADCLSEFDSVIERTKQKLEGYKQLKKGLMQRMFV